MKPAKRIIFNALTVLSLLLVVATTVLWVESYMAAICVTFLHDGKWGTVLVSHGALVVG